METLPRRFGSYILLERLARGGMGEIYLARRERGHPDHYVALKTLREDLTRDDEYVTRFLDEARVAIVLDHPVINRVFDVGFADGTYYLELEYISGRDLRSLLDRARDLERTIPREISLHITQELLSALGYLHHAKDINGTKLNLIHRDVSPQNLMLFWDGRANLIDFGLARFAARSTATQPGMVMGKLRYMAPEQARGKAIDRRVDLFAAGVMLYEALSGRRLYEEIPPSELWNTVAQGRALSAVHQDLIPEDLRPIVLRAMAVEPSDRYPDADIFIADLKRCRQDPEALTRTALRDLLADLFEVDLRLEQEFMEKLGHAAPFDLSTRESTQSVSLADPNAAIPESTEAHNAMPDMEPQFAAVVVQVNQPAKPKQPLQSDEPVKPITRPDELPAIKESPQFPSENDQSLEPKTDPAGSVTNDAHLSEETFIVSRLESNIEEEDRLPPPPHHGAELETTVRPAELLGATRPDNPAQSDIKQKFLLLWQDKALRYAFIAAGLALLLLVVVILIPRGAKAPSATQQQQSQTNPNLATQQGQQDKNKPLPKQGPDTKSSDNRRQHAVAIKNTGQNKPSAEPSRVNRSPGDNTKPVQVENNPSPKNKAPSDQAKTTPRDSSPIKVAKAKRPTHLSNSAERLLADLDKAMRGKGISVEDGLDLWPEYRGLQDLSLPDRQRAERVELLQRKVRLFSPDRGFIRSKLFRVQGDYQKIRPRLNQSSPLYKDLERRHYDALQSFANARSEEDLLQVNTVLNQFALAVKMATR